MTPPFHHASASVYVPDDAPAEHALARVTHLGIGAHHDDLEFMAFHGIAHCYRRADEWFGGVTCTDGAGSARTGPYADFTGEQMKAVRREEQNRAARIGEYGVMIQLDHPSAALQGNAAPLTRDLEAVLAAARPRVVYTHNLADKHATHIAVAIAALRALRTLPRAQQPNAVYGCEVWRDLDWLPDEDKIALDVSQHEELAAALNAVFDSQIAGGKRYDLATLGRRRANATFFQSHATDAVAQLSFAMDLTPLLTDPARDIEEFVCGYIDKFRADVRDTIRRQLTTAG